MESTREIHHASERLRSHLARYQWLTAVGIGQDQDRPCLVVYASRLGPTEQSMIPESWEGFRVILRRMALPRPLYH